MNKKIAIYLKKSLKIIILALIACSINYQSRENVSAKLSQQGNGTAAQYSYAYAITDCAPNDGPAIRIYLTNRTIDKEAVEKRNIAEPYLSIVIYSSASRIADKSFILGENFNVGSANLALPGKQHIVKKGKVQIKRVVANQSIEGEYDLEFDDGTNQKGIFQAKWLKHQTFCG